MSPQDNERIVRRVFEELWAGRLETAREIFSPDYRSHGPEWRSLAFRGANSAEDVILFVSAIRAASSDIRFELDEVVAEGDLVVARWVATGTHTGAFEGLEPTGRVVRLEGTMLYRLRQGLIVEGWHSWDYQDLMRQVNQETMCS